MPNAKNAESKVFFMNLIGDFYRYQIELIKVEDVPIYELSAIQKKTRRDRDNLM